MSADYFAGTPEGARLPVVNRRVTPTEAGKYMVRTDVIQIVESADYPGIGVVRLYEAPVTSYGGAGMVIKDYATGVALAGALTWPPTNLMFFVAPYQGRVYFNVNQIGSKMSVTYAGGGSLIDATDINHINDKASSAALPYKQITVPANGQVLLNQEAAMAVFGLNDDGVTYTPNPSWATIKIYDALDVHSYRSAIINSSGTAQVALVKTHKLYEVDA